MGEPVATRICFACQSEIPLQARICSNCSTVQNRGLWFVQRTGSMIGILSAILAFASYIVSSFPTIRQTFFWNDDIAVLAYSDGPIAIENTGDGEVYVSHIFLYAPELSFVTYRDVNRSIEPGKILTMDLGYIDTHEGYVLIREETSPEKISDWYPKFYRAVFDTGPEDERCYVFEFLSRNSSRFSFHFGDRDSPRYEAATGTVYFYSSKLGDLEKEFQAYVVVLEKPECRELQP